MFLFLLLLLFVFFAAHHRQRAVEARLELQEMKGSHGLRNSRLRKSKETELSKAKAERTFRRLDTTTNNKHNPSAQEVCC